MKINQTTRSYIAALVDSEGCICLSKSWKNNRPHYNIRLAISMNDLAAIALVKEHFGGNINIGNGMRKDGRIGHDCYVISYTINKTKQILLKILPYLRVKKDQAKLALKFIALRQSFNKQRKNGKSFGHLPSKIEDKYEYYYNECRRLKSHNWIKH